MCDLHQIIDIYLIQFLKAENAAGMWVGEKTG